MCILVMVGYLMKHKTSGMYHVGKKQFWGGFFKK